MTDGPPPTMLDYGPPNRPRPFYRRVSAWVVFVGSIAVTAFALELLHAPKSRPASGGAKCASNEQQIGLAILLYQQDHGGHYPDSLAAILSAQQIGASVLICPDSNDSPAVLPPPPPGQDQPTTQQATAALAVPGHASYIYCGHADWTDANVPADAVVLYEPVADHGNGSNILFGDGHAEFIQMPRAARLIAAAAATTRPVSAATVP